MGVDYVQDGIIYATIQAMVDIREYLDGAGQSPFAAWRSALNPEARAKVTTALYRIALGNFSNVRGVGLGVFECKINFGPGYRVYFGKDGAEIVVLLGGGTKKRQESDIQRAHERWADLKRQKKRQKEGN